jgi:hypothetical protein
MRLSIARRSRCALRRDFAGILVATYSFPRSLLMKLEKTDSKLILTSSAARVRFFGFSFALAGLLVSWSVSSAAGPALWAQIFLIGVGFFLIVGGALAVFAPSIATEFDLVTRHAAIQRQGWFNIRPQRTIIPFVEIAALTWKEHTDSEGMSDTYSLELERCDGKKFNLSADRESQPDLVLTSSVLMATGIRRH